MLILNHKIVPRRGTKDLCLGCHCIEVTVILDIGNAGYRTRTKLKPTFAEAVDSRDAEGKGQRERRVRLISSCGFSLENLF
jgi:hypothetical protein